MSWPSHQNPTTPDPKKEEVDGQEIKRVGTASSPYNFVPLPEAVVTVAEDADDLPDHDVYDAERRTGYFDVRLTTRSPLYIRAPLPLEDFEAQQAQSSSLPFREQIKNRPAFFYTRDERRPVLPGSSLRGMLRAPLEIVSYGKVSHISKEALFYRALDMRDFRDQFRNIEAGFLRRNGDTYAVIPCDFARLPRNLIGGAANLYDGEGYPVWDTSKAWHQHQQVWVTIAPNMENRWSPTHDRVRSIKPTSFSGSREGRIVITGDIEGRKQKEYVFLVPQPRVSSLDVSSAVIDLLHHKNQITEYQRGSYPVNEPRNDCREQPGFAEKNPAPPGEPVFFLRGNQDSLGVVRLLGRNPAFRLPSQSPGSLFGQARSPIDFVPPKLRSSEGLDYAEALFGRSEPSPLAGRVFVTDATTEVERPFEHEIVPQILSSPKPTAFQHYLVQDSDDKKKLRHYGSKTPKDTVIRGHKVYWHQGNRSLAQIKDEDVEDSSTQHTQMRPVSSGVDFCFRVYFENLSKAELGALCWTLHPQGASDKEHCHKLGMGKPLGMGAVKLQATLHLNDRRERYGALFDGDGWANGFRSDEDNAPAAESFDDYIEAFEQHVLEQLKASENASDETRQSSRLRDVPRIQALLKMMAWAGFSAAAEGGRYLSHEDRPNTRYMALEEFGDRSVLPDPLSFPEPEEGETPDPDLDPGAGRVFTGRVVSYAMREGKGMITPDAGGADVPVRAPSVEDFKNRGLLRPEQRVQFEIEDDADGVPEATHVTRL